MLLAESNYGRFAILEYPVHSQLPLLMSAQIFGSTLRSGLIVSDGRHFWKLPPEAGSQDKKTPLHSCFVKDHFDSVFAPSIGRAQDVLLRE